MTLPLHARREHAHAPAARIASAMSPTQSREARRGFDKSDRAAAAAARLRLGDRRSAATPPLVVAGVSKRASGCRASDRAWHSSRPAAARLTTAAGRSDRGRSSSMGPPPPVATLAVAHAPSKRIGASPTPPLRLAERRCRCHGPNRRVAACSVARAKQDRSSNLTSHFLPIRHLCSFSYPLAFRLL